MIAALLLALSGPLTPPPEELAGHFYGAVWFDLERNALIGNGNWPAALWYQAGDDEARVLHIQNLRCRRTGGRRYQCAFDLYRDGGPVMTIYNEMAPDRLSCAATLVHEREEGEWVWFVRHSPPPATAVTAGPAFNVTRPAPIRPARREGEPVLGEGFVSRSVMGRDQVLPKGRLQTKQLYR